jgi:pyridoxal biosynthesis lyase PdxS
VSLTPRTPLFSILDVTNVEEAKIAEECGAVAVMALERVPVSRINVFPHADVSS